MVSVVRRSQMIGLMSLDSSTATRFGTVQEVWIDQQGRVAYFSCREGYTPIEQIAMIGPDALLTYSHLLMQPELRIFPLYRRVVRLSASGDPVGWIEDFLFDWETGEILAYVLGGAIAEPFGGTAVIFPEDIEAIDVEAVIIKEDSPKRMKSEQEGLAGFLSEKSQQVQQLVKRMVDQLKSLVSPQDSPEVVKVKIRQVRDELSASHDANLLDEAANFLQEQWSVLQHSISRTAQRMENALKTAWQKLTGKK